MLRTDKGSFVGTIDVLVVGGGGCGLSAALSAHEHGAEVMVLERDSSALGTTSMSTGLIPGAASRFQKAKDIKDSPEAFASDIMHKTREETDRVMAMHMAKQSAPTVEWLADHCGVPLSLVDSFDYPGHSYRRMHGTPNRTGSELMGALHDAMARNGLDIALEAPVTDLFADDAGRVYGVRITRPDGTTEDLGCNALILACCGFAGSQDMLQEYIPEIVSAEFFGHPGNKGDAIRWGRAVGAAVGDIHAYQGHGGLAYGQGIPILWAHIMEGGFQVNAGGKRFSNEAKGYSEQAVEIAAQPNLFAWSIYDERCHELMKEFDDYNDALKVDCIRKANTVDELLAITKLPATLRKTLSDVTAMTRGEKEDDFGRDFTGHPVLEPPYYAVKVSPALFHTQGGLIVDLNGQVKRMDDSLLPNLYAGGGAARGISGPSCWGYLAGNGLITATALGRLSGRAAAQALR
ncbi:MAG: FAD-dependent oxidoreductase [Rhodospirillaceae bacterium]